MWYRRHYAREYAREKWELQNYAQGEKEEMVGLFSHKGLDRGRAETVVGVMSQAPEFFVGLMMTEELQLREPLSRSEFRAAAVAASYAAAALGPVLASNLFVARSFLIVDQTTAFFAVGILILAFLGARRAHSALLNVHTHVFEIVCLGFACALVPKLLVSAILSSNIL